MSFDRPDDGKPIVNVHKRTTKVNIWMAVAVVVFVIGGIIVAVMTRKWPQ